MNKTLIAYFSCSGRTKSVAHEIAKIIDGDLFEIVPVELYNSEDLDWTNDNSRTSIEMKDENCRPQIKNLPNNIFEYDKIYLGFPVWWYREPSIIDTFIEQNDLVGKEIYIFVTSGSSTYEGSLKHLKEKYTDLNFVDGRTLNNASENEIKKWIK